MRATGRPSLPAEPPAAPVGEVRGTITPVTAPTTTAATDLTHACVRCGAPVGLGVGLCENCNPLGLRDVKQVDTSILVPGTY